MTACQVCGKKIEQPARGLRRNCSDACRAKNAQDNRTGRGRFQVAVTFTPATAHKLRGKAGEGHGAVTRFVREAVETALRGGS